MLVFFRTLFAPPRELILLVAAGWLGLSLAERRLPRGGVNAELLNNLVLAGLLGYVVGGRIVYAAAHLAFIRLDPLSLISLNLGLFDSNGALAASVLAVFVYAQRKQLAFWPTMDALTPFLAALMVGRGFSHLASGAAFGSPTTLPWHWEQWGAERHPSQAYEILAAAGGLVLLMRRKGNAVPGADFLFFTALTAGWNLFLGGLRGDSILIAGGLRLAQLAAWGVLAAALVGLELLENQRAAQ